MLMPVRMLVRPMLAGFVVVLVGMCMIVLMLMFAFHVVRQMTMRVP
jgi:hypothetical protein